ncbi:DNA translocase FtsK 4TM domain-containing protein [Candidatus Proelusimicrobium volucris]|uniref:FtsK/SpoIIIE family DNA translocase n=1 Tax=Candidatus Proelusimicrobium volucris TaxID=3416225 RepID=UPI003D10D22E
MAYRTIHKRSKSKKPARKQGQGLGLLAVWVFSLAFCMWLTWVLWIGVQNGPSGKAVHDWLFGKFGQISLLLPLFLMYWLARTIKSKKLSVFTSLLGFFFTFGGLCTTFTFLGSLFPKSSITGGAFGGWIFEFVTSIAGKVGAIIFALACVFIGLHILFAIPWLATLRKTRELLSEDFNSWMQARAEFKEKVQEAKREEKQNQPRRVIHETEEPLKEPLPERQPPKISRPVAEMIKMPPRQNTPLHHIEKEGESASKEKKAGEDFILPPLDLLKEPSTTNIIGPTDEEIAAATKRLEATLKSFDIAASVTGVAPGPVVTRYEIKPDPGVKISSIVSISNDIALAMKARGIRVEAPIPGKDAIGFEIPNDKPLMVTMREILQDTSFVNSKFKTTVALGRYADGMPATSVLAKMPHLLIAGATNSGKSICVHSIIISLLYRAKPNEIKFLLVDPKRVELTLYEGIPHLYDPKTDCEDVSVVKDANGAVKSLQALVKVMEKRMKMFEFAKVKNIEGYNAWAEKNNEEKVFYIVVIIDEMADLMLQTKAAIEDSVQRLTQMGRALGIHLILCTQRPSTNVITGVIKANLPSRIALQVTSKIDSRVVLDANGADALLGKGDMLYLGISDPKPKRIQGCYISEEEITKVADFLRAQGGPDYPVQVQPEQNTAGGRPGEGLGTSPEELLSALRLIKERRRVSQDLLKANFGSSARATNILSVLEMKGFITKPEGSNRWEIHFDAIDEQIEQLQKGPAAQDTQYDTVYK